MSLGDQMHGSQSIWEWIEMKFLRLKQITGLAALFRDIKFGEAWRPVEEETGQKSK